MIGKIKGNVDEIRKWMKNKKVHFPIMIKAVAGGGGRGLVLVAGLALWVPSVAACDEGKRVAQRAPPAASWCWRGWPSCSRPPPSSPSSKDPTPSSGGRGTGKRSSSWRPGRKTRRSPPRCASC